MRTAIAFLAVFAAGVTLGYVLADPEPPAPEPEAPKPTPAVPDPEPEPEPMTAPEPAPALDATPDPEPEPAPKPVADPKPRAKPRVTPDGRVEVIVKLELPSGAPPESGRVYWSSDPSTPQNRLRRMAWKPPQTSAYVQAGDVYLFATSGTRENLKTEQVELRVSAEGPLQEVVLVLRERAGIHGKVTLPGEFEGFRPTVYLFRYAGSSPPEKPVFTHSMPRVSPRAKDGYSYAFHDLRAGGYLVGLALGRGFEVDVIEDVQVRDGMVEQDLQIDAFDPTRFMEVIVIGPDGKRVRNAQLTVSCKSNQGGSAGGNITMRRTDGVYVIDHAPQYTRREDGSYKEGVYTLRVSTRTYGEIVRTYDPTSTRTLTIRIDKPEDLVVELEDYRAGAGPRDLLVGLRASGELGVTNPRAIGRDGSVHFGQQSPGKYEVVIMVTSPSSALVAVHPIEFQPGDGSVKVPTPEFHRLVLRMPKNPVEPEFRLTRKFGTEQWGYGWGKPNHAGDIVFENLTAGTYTLKGHVGDRWIKRQVKVPEESVLRLD